MPGRYGLQGSGERQAVLAVVRQQQAEIARFLPEAVLARPEAVHRARVATRRLRSLLKTYAELFDPGPLPAYRQNLGRLARWLEGVRETDVLSTLLLTVAGEASLPQRAQQRLRGALRATQSGARAALRARLQGPSWCSVVRALARVADASLLVLRQGACDELVLHQAGRTLIKCRKGLERRPRSVPEWHALRLRIKRCRYALEPVYCVRKGQGVREVMACLALMQTLLGDHRDAVLALRWLQQQAPALGQATVRVLTERLHAREAQARTALGLVPA